MISGGGNRLLRPMKFGKSIMKMLKCRVAGWPKSFFRCLTFEIPRPISDAVGIGNRGVEIVHSLYKGLDQFPVWLIHSSISWY